MLPTALTSLHFNMIEVTRLNETNTREFINYLFDNQPLSESLSNILLERTDGIPLFIEELATTLKSQKLIHKIDGYFDFDVIDAV